MHFLFADVWKCISEKSQPLDLRTIIFAQMAVHAISYAWDNL
jgi:hypothetical protein